jgi:hypothetical protein
MTPNLDFLSDPTIFSLPEQDILYCLSKKDYAKTLQRLLEELDSRDKEEVMVSPRFAAAILQRMYQEVKVKVPTLISTIANQPRIPEEYNHLPRLFAGMAENGMMGIQVAASEEWVAEGVEIEMKKLLKGQEEDFSEKELDFFRLRAKGNYYFLAKAFVSAWSAFQEVEKDYPGQLEDHPPKKRVDLLLDGTKLGITLKEQGLHQLTEAEEDAREAYRLPAQANLPALEAVQVDNPTGRLTIQGRYGVLIEDGNVGYLESAFELLPSKSVKRMELRFCKLPQGKLPNAFFRFPNLTHLRIDSCDLAKLTNNLAGFKKLRHLTIVNAPKLEDLPLKIGGLTKLQSLTIDRSGLTDIPFSILECKQLKKLSITSSRLTYVNGFLGEMPTLVHANLGHNHIDEVEEGFMDSFRLRTLDLSHNRLQELPDNLHALGQLESLNLSQNPLAQIPAGIIYMNTLQFLQIDGKTINNLDHYLSFKNDLRTKIKVGEKLWEKGIGLW